MKRYEAYDSFLDIWVNEIPAHWKTHKMKYLFHERSEKGYPDEPLLVASQNMGVVPKKVYGNRTAEAQKDLHLLKLVRVDDFVISLRSFQGGLEYAYYQGIISPAYTVLTPHEPITAGYFRYLAKSKLFIGLLTLCVTGIREGQNIDYEKLRNHSLPVPPRTEQDQIVRYLDWQGSKINRLIAAKRKRIELVKEHFSVRIANIVCNGLKPNTPMRETGIDYIGAIPSHWTVLQNKRLFKSMNRTFQGIPTVLSLSQKDGLIPYSEMTERSLHTSSYENWQLVCPNDLVLNRFKAHLGVFFASKYTGIVTFHYGVYEAKMPLVAKYYEVLYHTPEYCRVYAGQSRGMTVGLQNLSDTNFYSTYTVYPPNEEQREIVTEIEQNEKQQSSIIAGVNRQIEKLQEFRTRLISDVVTGQVDVRGIEVPEYEAVQDMTEEQEEESEKIVEDE